MIIYFNRKFYEIVTVILVLLIFVSGCTRLWRQPLHDISLVPIDDKINLRVKLVITEQFRNAKWEKKWPAGDRFIVPLGENLVHHSKNLLKNIFLHSSISENLDDEVEVDYFLIPKFVSVKQSSGFSAFSEAKMSIIVEWALKNKFGKVAWVESFQGQATGKSGTLFSAKKYQEERVKLLLQDLFQKTEKAITSSRVIRSLAKN